MHPFETIGVMPCSSRKTYDCHPFPQVTSPYMHTLMSLVSSFPKTLERQSTS
jgi:hypothetical protein